MHFHRKMLLKFVLTCLLFILAVPAKAQHMKKVECNDKEDSAYCKVIVRKGKCDDGENKKDCKKSCNACPKAPKPMSKPVVTITAGKDRIKYKCKINGTVSTRYLVSWYASPSNTLLAKDKLRRGKLESFFFNKDLTKPVFCLGQSIYCAVSNLQYPKYAVSSDAVYAGLKVTPTGTVRLSEAGGPKRITVKSTVPIVCSDSTNNCGVRIKYQQTKNDIFIESKQPCGALLKATNVKPVTTFVVAKRDGYNDGNQNLMLNLAVEGSGSIGEWSCHKKLPSISIVTINVHNSRRTCSSTGDPRITTFDGKSYSHLSTGTFVLAKSSKRNFEVQVRERSCSRSDGVSCNFAMAAREGNDVVVVDMGWGNTPVARFASDSQPHPGTRFRISRNGKNFLVEFASGASVSFNARSVFANIDVKVPSDYARTMSGLCGNFDGNQHNDRNWNTRLSGASFFSRSTSGRRPCRAKTVPTTYHSCLTSGVASGTSNGFAPAKPLNIPGWTRLIHPGYAHCPTSRRKRRGADDDEIVLPDDGNATVYTFDPKEYTAPSLKGQHVYTESGARFECETSIRNSQAGKACDKVLGDAFDIGAAIKQCVEDIQASGTLEFVSSYVELAASDCKEKVSSDPSTWETDESGNLAPPTSVTDAICQNSCSKRGKCVKGECVCDAGFVSQDCSLKEGEKPELTSDVGLCDIRNQECLRVRVRGSKFLNNPNLKCRSSVASVRVGEAATSTKTYEDSTADLLSFGEVSCELPKLPVKTKFASEKGNPLGGYYLSVSNDGTSFSDKKELLLVYDSKCVICKDKGVCSWKDKNTFCMLNGYCFSEGDKHPEDACKVCDPSKSGFVTKKNNAPPAFKNTKKTDLIAFENQEWTLAVPAYDPEGVKLRKFELVSGPSDAKIDNKGSLTWTPSKQGNARFDIKVTDACGGLSTQNAYNIFVLPCSCFGSNGGRCEARPSEDSPRGYIAVCVCPPGCKGPKCLDNMDLMVCRRVSIDGGLSPWSTFSTCSKSCGAGVAKRTRKCNNPPPSNGGKDCTGPQIENKKCETIACPVDGGLSHWSAFSTCSKSCGAGEATRTRNCNNPPPSNGGKDCTGPQIENKKCETIACPDKPSIVCECSAYIKVPSVKAYCSVWFKSYPAFCYLAGGLAAKNCPGAQISSNGDFYYSYEMCKP